ncbi:hypothetical protein SELMODRAFT_445736 [Selaginella moellendorffii]|uniref:Pentacotripeptide-repeat region of PRORP domain-containing protein n=1 Tax=Selaginella moellendorffii TaxID=88036 RepID=D8SKU6_SELML|nr:hypothetical protein SELMODRAFT_445736 [Selaginella moellendorffii]
MRATASRAWRIIVAPSRWSNGQHSFAPPRLNPSASLGCRRAYAEAADAKDEDESGNDPEEGKKEKGSLVSLCLKTPDLSVRRIEAWAAQGNTVTQGNISEVIEALCVQKRFLAALRVMEFARQRTDFVFSLEDAKQEVTIATRKLGSFAGQKKINSLPEKFRSNEEVVAAYLRALTRINAASKALSLIKDLKPTTPALYSSMISVYAFLAMHEKMLALYTDMKELGIKPTLEIVMLMLLKYHKRVGGLPGIEEEARAALEEIDPHAAEPLIRNYMLEMYGYLGDRDKVENIWSIIRAQPGGTFRNCYFSAMLAFGYLQDVDRAEELLRESVEVVKVIPGRNQYFKMLDVYAKMGMMDKAEKLLEERAEDQYRNFYPCNALVEGYLSLNDPDKALKKMEELGSSRPSYEAVVGLLPVLESKKDTLATKKLIRAYLFQYRGDVYLYNKMLKVYVAAGKRPGPRMLARFEIDPNDETRELMKVIEGFPEPTESEDVIMEESEKKVEKKVEDKPSAESKKNKSKNKKKKNEESSKQEKRPEGKWEFLQSLV